MGRWPSQTCKQEAGNTYLNLMFCRFPGRTSDPLPSLNSLPTRSTRSQAIDFSPLWQDFYVPITPAKRMRGFNLANAVNKLNEVAEDAPASFERWGSWSANSLTLLRCAVPSMSCDGSRADCSFMIECTSIVPKECQAGLLCLVNQVGLKSGCTEQTLPTGRHFLWSESLGSGRMEWRMQTP